MKISKKQLRKIIKEEAHDCYKDYKMGGLSYKEYQDCLKRYAHEDSGYSPRPRKTSHVGADANQDKIAAVQAALAVKQNSFLQSVLSQLQAGRGLSAKQKATVKRILSKKDPEAAKLFEANKILSKSRLKRIIEEAVSDDDRDFSPPPGEEDYYAPGGEGELVTDAQLKRGWGSWLEERDLEFEDLDDLALSAGAPNRTWLDHTPPSDGFIGPLDVEVWVKDIQAAKEILSTRMGDYSSSPHVKKVKEGKMKITKRQLRRIIKEELRTLKEQPRDPRGARASQGTGWDNFTPEGEAEDEMHLAAEDLPELLRAIEFNKESAAGSNMADTYESDAGQLQDIYDMSKDAIENMQTTPPDQLSNYISRLDTIVREQIPMNLYNWIVGQR
jgi:hypothetical protein